MTAVPRLQLLPAPVATSGALAVAAPGQDAAEQRVKPVAPVAAAQRNGPEPDRSLFEGAGDHGGLERGRSGGRGTTLRDRAGSSNTAAGALQSDFSGLSSLPFMVQLLGQQVSAERSQAAVPQTSLAGHRDAAVLGSDIYRRAGGEPQMLPDSATFIRLAV